MENAREKKRGSIKEHPFRSRRRVDRPADREGKVAEEKEEEEEEEEEKRGTMDAGRRMAGGSFTALKGLRERAPWRSFQRSARDNRRHNFPPGARSCASSSAFLARQRRCCAPLARSSA